MGHRSPETFRYDQPENEWLMVLQGAVRLEFEDRVVELVAGDSINIPCLSEAPGGVDVTTGADGVVGGVLRWVRGIGARGGHTSNLVIVSEDATLVTNPASRPPDTLSA
jgi:hypothetical protein